MGATLQPEATIDAPPRRRPHRPPFKEKGGPGSCPAPGPRGSMRQRRRPHRDCRSNGSTAALMSCRPDEAANCRNRLQHVSHGPTASTELCAQRHPRPFGVSSTALDRLRAIPWPSRTAGRCWRAWTAGRGDTGPAGPPGETGNSNLRAFDVDEDIASCREDEIAVSAICKNDLQRRSAAAVTAPTAAALPATKL
jgi:hypothetical protein